MKGFFDSVGHKSQPDLKDHCKKCNRVLHSSASQNSLSRLCGPCFRESEEAKSIPKRYL